MQLVRETIEVYARQSHPDESAETGAEQNHWDEPPETRSTTFTLEIPTIHVAHSQLHRLLQLLTQACQLHPQLPKALRDFQMKTPEHPLNNQKEMV